MKKQAIFQADQIKYYFEDLEEALKKVGVREGDNLFVHSDLGHFGKLADVKDKDEFLSLFVKALLKAVGSKGTLIMPTFSYSYCSNKIYDPKTTSSTVGVLTEYFRNLPGVVRSLDAIFSVSARGPKKKYFTNVGFDCFNKDSIFDKLYKKNVTILFLGKTFDITFMHYVEKQFGVKYRFDKEFKGKTRIGKILKDFNFKYFVRYLDKNVNYDLERINKFLDKQGVLKTTRLGHSSVCAIKAKDAFNKISEGLKKNQYILLKKTPNL